MRKLLILFAAVLLVSCAKEEVEPREIREVNVQSVVLFAEYQEVIVVSDEGEQHFEEHSEGFNYTFTATSKSVAGIRHIAQSDTGYCSLRVSVDGVPFSVEDYQWTEMPPNGYVSLVITLP